MSIEIPDDFRKHTVDIKAEDHTMDLFEFTREANGTYSVSTFNGDIFPKEGELIVTGRTGVLKVIKNGKRHLVNLANAQ